MKSNRGIIMIVAIALVILFVVNTVPGAALTNNIASASTYLTSVGYTVLPPGTDYVPVLPSGNVTFAENVTVSGTLYAKTGRAATYSLASYTASGLVKSQADLVCDNDGDDAEEMREALTAAGAYSSIKLLGGNFAMLSSVNITSDGVNFDASAANITYNGTGHAFAWQPLDSSSFIRFGSFKLGNLVAIGNALTSTNATGVIIKQVQEAEFSGHVLDFRAGTNVRIDSDESWTGLLTIPKLDSRFSRNGLKFTGDNATHAITIGEYWWAPYDATAPNFGICDNKSAQAANNIQLGTVWLEPNTTTNCTGILAKGTNWIINKLIWDNNVTNIASINSTHPIVLNQVDTQAGSIRALTDMVVPASSLAQAVENTYGGRRISVELTDWADSVNGTGSSNKFAMYQSNATGATGNSTAGSYIRTYGLGAAGGSISLIDWSRPLYYNFTYLRSTSDTNALAYVGIAESYAQANLTADGLRIKVANQSLYGESYGSAQAEVAVGLDANVARNIYVFYFPDKKIRWFVDGTIVEQTTAANLPSGLAGSENFFVHTIQNATATEIGSVITSLVIWQGN